MKKVKAVKLEVRDGINPRRRITLRVQGRKDLPLSGVGQPPGLAQLEKEGQQVVDDVRSQSSNPLDPRVQEQVAQVQQQVASKRNELEDQKRNLLQQQVQIRDLEMEEIVEQGQIESFCEVNVGENLVKKMQVSIVVRDGVVEAIQQE